MQHSDKPFQELDLAKALIEQMEQAKTLADLEAFWKRYLHHLDRVWNKAEAHFSKSPKWSGWHGKYAQLRKKDQLLVYLVKARDADEHSISDITEKQPGSWSLDAATPGGELYVKKLIIGPRGEIQHLETGTPFKLDVVASRVKLLPATNRGRTYPPPTEHLGKAVSSNDLIDLARKGTSFYEEFLDSAEGFFVDATMRFASLKD